MAATDQAVYTLSLGIAMVVLILVITATAFGCDSVQPSVLDAVSCLQVDAALLTALKPELKGYLSARFSLKKNDRPHLMAF